MLNCDNSSNKFYYSALKTFQVWVQVEAKAQTQTLLTVIEKSLKLSTKTGNNRSDGNERLYSRAKLWRETTRK